MRNLIAFAPRKYATKIIEEMALAGVLDPEGTASQRPWKRLPSV